MGGFGHARRDRPTGVRSCMLSSGLLGTSAGHLSRQTFLALPLVRQWPRPLDGATACSAAFAPPELESLLPRPSRDRARWVAGAIPVPHPVFRARGRLGGGLGLAAGAVCAALSDVPSPVRALAAAARVGAGRRVLVRLAEHGLAVRGSGGWTRGPAALDRVADRLGVGEYLALLAARYRADRASYHALRRRLHERTQPAETVGAPVTSSTACPLLTRRPTRTPTRRSPSSGTSSAARSSRMPRPDRWATPARPDDVRAGSGGCRSAGRFASSRRGHRARRPAGAQWRGSARVAGRHGMLTSVRVTVLLHHDDEHIGCPCCGEPAALSRSPLRRRRARSAPPHPTRTPVDTA